jgi:hypothetical protein
VFFEIDVRFDITLGLRRFGKQQIRPLSPADELSRKPLQFPEYHYEKHPISLYWYARRAFGMPLLQFLAFYQTIEYYFPMYSRNEAIKRVRTFLKDPSFNVHSDGDVSRLISSLEPGRSGGLGDERAQLRATIIQCVEARDLREFLESDERLGRFYKAQAEWKTISDKKIPLGNTEADLRNDVADRIYEIRCKIVHAKGDGGPAKWRRSFRSRKKRIYRVSI